MRISRSLYEKKPFFLQNSPGAKLKSRRDLIKSRRDLLKLRRDLIKSRRDLILFKAICPKRLALNKTNRTARYYLYV